ncbi:MAG: hypothetical protein WBF81_03050, partial [Thermoplasmata archaeon]
MRPALSFGMRSRLVALAIIVVVVVSGAGAWWILGERSGSGSPTLKADGPTLYQAIESANRTVRNQSGGPWGLFSIVGVAAQAPFSANVLGWGLGANETTNACGAQFNGLTLWNGTMPIYDGSFESGTIPFWQFGYYSNVSSALLLATDVLGAVTVYRPVAVMGSCYPWHDLGNPQSWVQNLSISFADSPFALQSAWNTIEQSQIEKIGPTVEIVTTGPGMFSGYGDVTGGFGLYFERCGQFGVTGLQPSLIVGENWNGSVGLVMNGTTNCAFLNQPYFAGYGYYDLLFASVNSSALTGTYQLTVPF